MRLSGSREFPGQAWRNGVIALLRCATDGHLREAQGEVEWAWFSDLGRNR